MASGKPLFVPAGTSIAAALATSPNPVHRRALEYARETKGLYDLEKGKMPEESGSGTFFNLFMGK